MARALESSFELLDAPEEWFYDMNTKILYSQASQNILDNILII